jgi:nucleotide-binding universal stress UspA family protein
MWFAKKILVATDFAESSRSAADAGVELARTLRLPLVLLHAYQVPASVYRGTPFTPFEDYVQAYEQGARECLEKEKGRLVGKGAEVTTILQVGAPWEQILATAEQVDAGLIVVGTHGRRGLPRALLGSVAEKVVRLSRIPVLTIHAGEASPATVSGNVGGESRSREGRTMAGCG